MTIELRVPALPESVSDATIADWHKKPGDAVRRDENLVDLETDKVVLEVPAPADGVLKEIKAEAGATVNADDLLGIMEAGAGAAPSAPKDEPSPASEQAPEPAPAPKAAAADSGDLSPAVRRLVNENKLDASAIEGTGRGGRLTKGDVLGVMQEGGTGGARDEKRVPMSRLRARIAARMVEAQSTAAMLTSFNEVNLRQVMAIRKRYKESFEKQHGVRLGLMSFFVKAAAEALEKYPSVNASLDGTDMIYHGYADIGIAVATERGLLVPVLRNAESMGMAEIEGQIAAYAASARAGTIKLEELQGGTFTITNGGVFGSLVSTPILNPPQSAILGMHTIKQRPVVEDGQIVAAPMMYLALTYDHRIIDGKEAVLFLVAIKDALEDPHRMLLGL